MQVLEGHQKEEKAVRDERTIQGHVLASSGNGVGGFTGARIEAYGTYQWARK